MDWTNERYVRLYTRDTDDWLVLSWQARALFPLLLRKVDRSGFLDTKRGVIGVAAQTGLPLEIVTAGLPDLLRDGSVVECEGGYLMPNYIDAQEAPQSDAQRAKELRERRRDRNRKGASRNVTAGSEPHQHGVSVGKVHHVDMSRSVVGASQTVTGESRNAVKPSLQPVQPVQPVQPASSNSAGERTTAQRLVIAANQTIAATIGEQTRPLLAQHAASHELAHAIESAAVPIEFAERSVARQAARLKHPPRTMAYFRAGILDDWAQHNERVAAAGADPVQPLTRPKSSGPTSLVDALLQPKAS